MVNLYIGHDGAVPVEFGGLVPYRDYQKVESENTRLRAKLEKANDHPLVLEEGGTDGIDRCHRVINKQQVEIKRLQAKNQTLEATVVYQESPHLAQRAEKTLLDFKKDEDELKEAKAEIQRLTEQLQCIKRVISDFTDGAHMLLDISKMHVKNLRNELQKIDDK